MNRHSFLFPAIFILIISISSCDRCNKPQGTTDQPAKAVTVNAPEFNSDSAYAYTAAQVAFGPRNMNSKGHEDCAKWLIEKAKLYADTVYVQKFEVKGFDGTMLKCTNIIASFNPQATNRILITSHWDSRPWADQDKVDRDKPILAACDGASGGATMLAIAQAIKSKPTSIGVDLFFNDAEDYGYSHTLEGIVKQKVEGDAEETYCLGAQYWCKNPHVPGYKADFGILLDMAAAHNAVFTREGTSSFNAGWVLDKVWNNASTLGYSSFFSNQQTTAITDDHVCINQVTKIPTIDIIQYDASSRSGLFPDYWHTHADNMDVIDKITLQAVGKVLLYTIYQREAEKKAGQ